VTENQRQVGWDRVGEPAVDDVKIGAAQPGAADPDHHVVWPGRLGLRHVVQPWRLPV
jgi:hypothetical protein